MDSPLDEPIIIFGTGRCGSTIFELMLAEHEDLGWLSGVTSPYPDRPWLNRMVLRAYDTPGVQTLARKVVSPGEPYTFWEHHCKGFQRPMRDLRADDVTERTRRNLYKILPKVLTPSRNRFLTKITGWPRARFFDELFPDARFIEIVRDGRAVVNSMVKTEFWEGWRGPQNWRWGELPPNYRKEWEHHDQSFLALASIQLKILKDAVEKCRTVLGDSRFLTLHYEDFCQNPGEALQQVCTFSQLPWSSRLDRALDLYDVENANWKWEEDLSNSQQSIVEETIQPYQEYYGYSRGA